MKKKLVLIMFTILGVSQVYAFGQDECVQITKDNNVIFPDVVPAKYQVNNSAYNYLDSWGNHQNGVGFIGEYCRISNSNGRSLYRGVTNENPNVQMTCDQVHQNGIPLSAHANQERPKIANELLWKKAIGTKSPNNPWEFYSCTTTIGGISTSWDIQYAENYGYDPIRHPQGITITLNWDAMLNAENNQQAPYKYTDNIPHGIAVLPSCNAWAFTRFVMPDTPERDQTEVFFMNSIPAQYVSACRDAQGLHQYN